MSRVNNKRDYIIILALALKVWKQLELHLSQHPARLWVVIL